MAGSQNVLSQIGNLLSSLSPIDNSSPPSRHAKADTRSWDGHQKSTYASHMSQDHHRSSSASRRQRWNDECFTHEQERNRSRHRIDREFRHKVTASQPQVRERSITQVEPREPSLAPRIDTRYKRRQTIMSELPYLPGDHMGQKHQERKELHSHSPSPPRRREFLTRPTVHRRQSSLDSFDRDYLKQKNRRRKEHHFHSPSSPRRRELPARPTVRRRQSSLDTFDRKIYHQAEEIEQHGPPTRYRETPFRSPVPGQPPYPDFSPPRRYARDHHYVNKNDEPYFPSDELIKSHAEYQQARDFRNLRGKSRRGRSPNESFRSNSLSSNWSSTSESSVRKEYPKRGKTKIPVKLIHKNAIIDLGYPFEESGEIITILKALGKDNIKDLLELSERYKAAERAKLQEREDRTGIYTVNPAPHYYDQVSGNYNSTDIPISLQAPAPPINNAYSTVSTSTPQIVVPDSAITSVNVQTSVSPRTKDENSINAEIEALQAEKEELRIQRLIDNLKLEGQEAVIIREEHDRDGYRKEITVVRRDEKRQSNCEKSHGRDEKGHSHGKNHNHKKMKNGKNSKGRKSLFTLKRILL